VQEALKYVIPFVLPAYSRFVLYMPFMSPADKIIPQTKSDGVKKVINGMKNNEAAGAEILYSESFECGGKEIKN
jgi:hypothetical protein